MIFIILCLFMFKYYNYEYKLMSTDRRHRRLSDGYSFHLDHIASEGDGRIKGKRIYLLYFRHYLIKFHFYFLFISFFLSSLLHSSLLSSFYTITLPSICIEEICEREEREKEERDMFVCVFCGREEYE